MIGNDIIDLKLAALQSNWKRRGFLNKIFNKQEQSIIFNATDPFIKVWLLWSMKESAYKIFSKQFQSRFFAPLKFNCELYHGLKGMVKYKNQNYSTTTIITSEFIHTIAKINPNENSSSACFKSGTSYAQQHGITSKRLKVFVSQKHRSSLEHLTIKKNKIGIPALYLNDTKINRSFSMSHHGAYGAYAIVK